MSEVEHIALWVGLLGSVISIVLSLVAIWFAVHVNTRSENVSDQTIKSLQKIESFVQRLSEDTSGLVKAAWDKMLGNFHPAESVAGKAADKEVASGLTAELRTELEEESEPDGNTSAAGLRERYEKMLTLLEKSLESQFASSRIRGRSKGVYSLYKSLSKLSPTAQELLNQIKSYHLTRRQYKSLNSSSVGFAIGELREAGLLVPLRGYDGAKEIPVYWYPPSTADNLRKAMLAVRPRDSQTIEIVKNTLRDAGYQGRPVSTS